MPGPVWHPALLIRILLMTHILCLCSIALTWLKIRKYIFKDPLQVAHSSPCRRPMVLHWSLSDVCAVSKLTFVQTEYCIFITEFKRNFIPRTSTKWSPSCAFLTIWLFSHPFYPKHTFVLWNGVSQLDILPPVLIMFILIISLPFKSFFFPYCNSAATAISLVFLHLSYITFQAHHWIHNSLHPHPLTQWHTVIHFFQALLLTVGSISLQFPLSIFCWIVAIYFQDHSCVNVLTVCHISHLFLELYPCL